MSSPGSTQPRGPTRIGPPPPDPPEPALTEPVPRGRAVAFAIYGMTVIQLVLAAIAPALPQFQGRAFDARVWTYPVLMLIPPGVWWVVRKRRHGTRQMPWAGFALLMMPFLIDVTANAVDFYHSAPWWHDVNEFLDWFLIGLGAGVLLLRSAIRQAWVLGLLITGIGAMIAIGWEIGQWYALIRNGNPPETAYATTLTDETLGTLGAAGAGIAFWVWHIRRRRTRRQQYKQPPPGAPKLRVVK